MAERFFYATAGQIRSTNTTPPVLALEIASDSYYIHAIQPKLLRVRIQLNLNPLQRNAQAHSEIRRCYIQLKQYNKPITIVYRYVHISTSPGYQ
jgi:hypothetical protein